MAVGEVSAHEREMSVSPITVVVFDFDGTLTWTDTFAPFLRHVVGRRRFAAGLVKHRRILRGYMRGTVDNATAKTALLTEFLKGLSEEELRDAGAAYAGQIRRNQLNPLAVQALNQHLRKGHRVIISSASLHAYVDPIAQLLDVPTVCATRLEVVDGHLTGALDGPNCWGPEKVNRLEPLLPRDMPFQLIAYGDSRGDKELLALADEAHFQPFRDGEHKWKARKAFLDALS